ncbi:MAG: hypothetical protein LBH77_07710 [Tannerella sp.]|jgi:3-oxoacyl-(acyl-carrier-protein) synthase|nr:hypothetical protein [Tannerella sp.]
MSIYIQSANQISVQKPLSDEWFDNPVFYDEIRVPTLDPGFNEHFSPLEARRMNVLLKRAVMMARLTLQEASVEMPDAIISGTGLGCIENTEKFLWSIMENDEKFLQPTFFMQSTHNILSATIAMKLKCHGYNNTFVHRGASFESVLLDAFMQFERQRIKTALVGGYDELTNDYFKFFERIGIWDFINGPSPKQKCFAGEAAVSMLLGTEKNGRTICEINDVELMYKPSSGRLKEKLDAVLAKAGCGLPDIDAVLTGLSTHAENDRVYNDVITQLFSDRPIMQYKHLFGESFSSSALAVYVAATCLHKNRIPSILLADNRPSSGGVCGSDKGAMRFDTSGNKGDMKGVKRILVYNHYRNQSHSFILLSCLN